MYHLDVGKYVVSWCSRLLQYDSTKRGNSNALAHGPINRVFVVTWPKLQMSPRGGVPQMPRTLHLSHTHQMAFQEGRKEQK